MSQATINILLNQCKKYQRLISLSTFAKYMLFALMIFCALTCAVSGLILAGASHADTISQASTVFYTSLPTLVVLILGTIFSPAPNEFGTMLVANAANIPERNAHMTALKSKLIKVGHQAIEWKF